MDSPAAAYILHRLARFEQSIDDTRRHFPDLESFGQWSASAPYVEKCAIGSLLRSPEIPDSERQALLQEYCRITERLNSFRREKGQEYCDLLFCDLQAFAHACHAEVCHAHLGQNSVGEAGANTDLSRRELLLELCRELKTDFDLSGIEALIAMLDENMGVLTGSPQGSLSDNTLSTQAGYNPHGCVTGRTPSPHD